MLLYFLSFFSVFLQVISLTQDNIVIGIYTQEYFYGDIPNYISQSTLTYILPTYQNIVHMAGAQAVPIYSYSSQAEILQTLKKINGVIFTGGQQYIDINNTWTKNAQFILKYAQTQNDQGRVFPILGTCQGLELLLYLTTDQKPNFLDDIKGQQGVYNTLNFMNYNYYLLQGLSPETMKALQDPTYTPQGGAVYFYHQWGIMIQHFYNDEDLTLYWNLYSTTSRYNQTFISYLQAKHYPFYITLFHFQRLTYEKNMSNTFYKARIDLANTIALNFIMKAKQSSHQYPKQQLETDIIDNFQTYQNQRFPYTQVYIFHEFSGNEKYVNQGLDLTVLLIIVGLMLGIVFYSGFKYYANNKNYCTQQKVQNNLNNQIQLNQDLN